jgi:hypothetical protein
MRFAATGWRAGLILLVLSCVAAADEHSITITGPAQLYFAQKDMACGGLARGAGADRPDVMVNAFRRKDGSVIVLAGNQNNYYLEGPSVDEARRKSCASLVPPVNDPDPQKFVGRRWLVAITAKRHDFVLGIVHNEFHGNDFFDGCKRTNKRDFECWYAATTMVLSRDGGFTFETPPAPQNVLAAPAVRFEIGKKRVGTSSAKAVVNPHDGMTYVMATYRDRNRNIAYECLLRGSGESLDDWRAWDGQDFKLNMGSPYTTERAADCAQVVHFAVRSVKYVPAIRQFVALGNRGGQVIYSFSPDLIRWSKEKELMAFQPHQTWTPGKPAARAYFSLLDSGSQSINFDTIEGAPYVYFVQFGTHDARTFRHVREVYRIPVKIE